MRKKILKVNLREATESKVIADINRSIIKTNGLVSVLKFISFILA